jgi:hypothetical protein
MDSGVKSAAEVARDLGTSVPRVVRAVDRLGLKARVGTSNRMALTSSMVARLEDELGRVPSSPVLSSIEIRALAALREAPFGISSARTLALRSGMSPTSAAAALRTLRDKDLAYTEQQMVAAGRARPAEVWKANRQAPQWPQLTDLLDKTRAPRSRTTDETVVPLRLRHLFWNTSPDQLNIQHAGGYIARRLLTTMDPEGLSWGARHLSADSWLHAAQARGIDERTRALAHNLAEQS